ncbi:MAG: hypothetical protein K1V89_01115, partial [Muribaculaceae bacterium]
AAGAADEILIKTGVFRIYGRNGCLLRCVGCYLRETPFFIRENSARRGGRRFTFAGKFKPTIYF